MNQRVLRFDHSTLRQVFRHAFELATSLAAGELVIREPKRSLDQNAKMWPMLADVAKQCDLVINGRAVKAEPEDWKEVFTAALRREQRMAMGIDGGLVVLGARTSKMRKREFSELLELIYAYGAEHGVQWSEPAVAAYEQYREAA